MFEPYLGLVDFSVLAAACMGNLLLGTRRGAMPTCASPVIRTEHPVGFWLAGLLQLAIAAESVFLLLMLPL